jgi:hypothetical protein
MVNSFDEDSGCLARGLISIWEEEQVERMD